MSNGAILRESKKACVQVYVGENLKGFLQISTIFGSLKVKIDPQNPLNLLYFTGRFKGGNGSILSLDDSKMVETWRKPSKFSPA